MTSGFPVSIPGSGWFSDQSHRTSLSPSPFLPSVHCRAGHTSRAPAVSAGPGQVHRGKREAGKEEDRWVEGQSE